MMKWATLHLALGLILSCMGFAAAQDRARATQIAVNNMAKEMVECAAYFDIVSLAMLHSSQHDTAENYIKARKLAVGRANSLSPGVVNARYNMLIRDMTNRIIIANITKRIDESLSNVAITDISVLHDQYGKLCKEVLSSPGARAKYWMGQAGSPSR